MLYAYSVMFIVQTITTVGYGNTSYSTTTEYIFCWLLESTCLVYNSMILRLMFDLGRLQSNRFEKIMKLRMLELKKWMVKV